MDNLFVKKQIINLVQFLVCCLKRVFALSLERNRFVSSAKSTRSKPLVDLLWLFTKIRKTNSPSIES